MTSGVVFWAGKVGTLTPAGSGSTNADSVRKGTSSIGRVSVGIEMEAMASNGVGAEDVGPVGTGAEGMASVETGAEGVTPVEVGAEGVASVETGPEGMTPVEVGAEGMAS
jgi:hypothetical protein